MIEITWFKATPDNPTAITFRSVNEVNMVLKMRHLIVNQTASDDGMTITNNNYWSDWQPITMATDLDLSGKGVPMPEDPCDPTQEAEEEAIARLEADQEEHYDLDAAMDKADMAADAGISGVTNEEKDMLLEESPLVGIADAITVSKSKPKSNKKTKKQID